mmetsp:Transcript_13656/g.27986  ORF Transcript_13656/g.27986 Transcript_13656/m.27986 type:complete len:80 (+) Transcript_13656:2176-2415(+)
MERRIARLDTVNWVSILLVDSHVSRYTDMREIPPKLGQKNLVDARLDSALGGLKRVDSPRLHPPFSRCPFPIWDANSRS